MRDEARHQRQQELQLPSQSQPLGNRAASHVFRRSTNLSYRCSRPTWEDRCLQFGLYQASWFLKMRSSPRCIARAFEPARAVSSRAAQLSTSRFQRHFSASASNSDSPPSPSSDAAITDRLSPRWLSDLKSRIGRCIQFGLTPPQIREAGLILRNISDDWHELVAGSEGFLTSWDRRQTFKHDVVWGEMVSPHGTSQLAWLSLLMAFGHDVPMYLIYPVIECPHVQTRS